MLTILQGSDILGICHISEDTAETRYFLILGKYDPDDPDNSYTYGVVMYDDINDVVQHCTEKVRALSDCAW